MSSNKLRFIDDALLILLKIIVQVIFNLHIADMISQIIGY